MALNAPTGLTEVSSTIGSVEISFTDTNSGNTWYMAERRLKSGGDWIPVYQTDTHGETTVYDRNDDGLQSVGEVYEYRITAFNGTPEFSSPSSILEVTLTAVPVASVAQSRNSISTSIRVGL